MKPVKKFSGSEKKNHGLRVASSIFFVVGLVHFSIVLLRSNVSVGNFTFPLWFNSAALVIAGALSLWFWLLTKE